VQVECDGAAVAEAVRAFAGAFGAQPAVTVHLPPEPLAALPESRKAARAPRQLKAAPPAEAKDELGTSPLALAKLALREGPKTKAQVLAWIQSHGLPDYDARKLSGLLTYQARLGRFKRSGGHLDGIWSLA
jgi:peptidoglycan hydrolase-like protein with peptidoglycan-binding domain